MTRQNRRQRMGQPAQQQRQPQSGQQQPHQQAAQQPAQQPAQAQQARPSQQTAQTPQPAQQAAQAAYQAAQAAQQAAQIAQSQPSQQQAPQPAAQQQAAQQPQAQEPGQQQLIAQPSQPQRQPLTQQSQAQFTPPVDVIDNPDDVTVLTDLPGCDPENVSLQATDDQLTIAAERLEVEEKEEAKEGRPVQRERGQTAERTVQLPASVDIDDAEATHENGVCQVVLPKTEEARKREIGFQ